MVRRYGWALRGERLVTAAPHGHWRTTTFVAGLRSTGLVAPMVLDGPMNGAAFLACVQQVLAPMRRRGDVVVMDSLAARKVTGIEAAIRAVGASVPYLPLCSPDLNPVEQASAKLKALLRVPRPEPGRRSGPPSASSSPASAPQSAATASPTQDRSSREAKTLQPVQARDRRRAALAHGPPPRNGDRPCCRRPEPHARTRTAGARPPGVTADAGRCLTPVFRSIQHGRPNGNRRRPKPRKLTASHPETRRRTGWTLLPAR